MIDTRYWRTTAYLGFMAATILGIIFILAAFNPGQGFVEINFSRENVPHEAMGEASFAFLLVWFLPYTLITVFWVAFGLIVIPPRNLLLQYMVVILSGLFYLVYLMAGSTVTYVPVIAATDEYRETISNTMGVFFRIGTWLSVFIIGIYGLALWQQRGKQPIQHIWPRWLMGLSLGYPIGFLLKDLLLYNTLDSNIHRFTLVLIPLWMVLVSAHLLLLDARVRVTLQEKTSAELEHGEDSP